MVSNTGVGAMMHGAFFAVAKAYLLQSYANLKQGNAVKGVLLIQAISFLLKGV